MNFNFGRFFQQFGYTSQLDSLLEKKDVTLENILDEENILQEIRNMGSTKFANFIIANPHNFVKMIEYIISYEDELIDRKRQIRYPFMVSEIFGSENARLIDFLFGKIDNSESEETKEVNPVWETLLPYFLSFLERDSICMTAAGYFNKSIVTIIKRRGYDLWDFLVKHPDHLSNLIKHLDVYHIADIIEKLLILDTQQEISDLTTFFNQRQNLLERIIRFMSSKQHCTFVVENVSNILNEIVQKGLSNINGNTTEILSLIETIKKPTLLYSIAYKTQNPATFRVLISLIEFISRGDSVPKNDEDDDIVNSEMEKDYSSFYPIIAEIPKACNQENLNLLDFESTTGEIVHPLGAGKLNLIRLIQSLLQVKDDKINKCLIQHRVFQELELLVIKYESNNQLHLIFEKIVQGVIESEQSYLQEGLLIDAHLLDFIVANNNSQKPAESKGYHGLLSKLSNYLNEKASGSKVLERAIQSISEIWIEYMEGQLKRINDKEQKWLCGINPKQNQNQNEEEDLQTESDVAKILQKFNHQSNDQNNQQEDNSNDNDQNKEVEIEENIEEEPESEPSYIPEEKNLQDVQVVRDEFQHNRFWKTGQQLNQDQINQLLEDYD